MRARQRARGSFWSAIVAVVLIATAACGGGAANPSPSIVGSASAAPSASATRSLGKDDALAAKVPAQYRSKGEVVVAVTVFPPFEVYGANNEVTGADPDLYAAIGKVLDLKFKFVDTKFSSIIPGIQSGRYDLSSPLGDFVERQEIVGFVDYSKGGSSALVNAGGSFQPHTVMDLCGHSVGIEAGSAEQNVTRAISEMCTKAGKSALTVNNYPDVAAASLAVKSGRADALLTDSAANGYHAKLSNGEFASNGLSGGESIPGWGATFGIVFPKDSPLGDALLGALKKIVAAGVYDQIFQSWGLQDNRIPLEQMKINGSTAYQKK